MSSQTIKNSWDLEIKPSRKIFDVKIKELWTYRDLIILFIRRDLVTKYKQTILGPLWFIVQPILTTLMYLLVFRRIANIPTEEVPAIPFYLTGIIAWTYFSICLNSTAITFLTNASLFGKVYFPRLSVPISVIISNLIQFLIQFLLVITVIVFYSTKGFSPHISSSILLLPVLILMLAFLGLGFGILISSLTTKYRDLTNLLSFGVQLWMYATPIIYPLSFIPEKYKIFILANPLSSIIITFRSILLGTPSATFYQLLYSFGFTLFVLFFGIIVYNRVEKSFMDTI
jgi:lipopolysaccharide transport system permease protein